MLKYRGQYRACYEMDKAGKPCEFTFIPCGIKKGANIYRYSKDRLAVYVPGIKMAHRLLQEYADIFTPFQVGDIEASLLFKESDMAKAATIIKARVLGKNMNPKPKRKVVLSEERKRILSDRMKELNRYKNSLEKIGVNGV